LIDLDYKKIALLGRPTVKAFQDFFRLNGSLKGVWIEASAHPARA
jgi:hypothetical protein